MKNHINLLITLSILALLAIVLSLDKGSIYFSLRQVFSDPLSHEVLFSIRLPRTLCAFVTGGLLALAGALMQLLLRNPLADPYALGTSGGAALVTMLLLWIGVSEFWLTAGAWFGSLFSMLLVFFLAQAFLWNTQRVLLTGIALASGFSAVMSLILLLSPEHELRNMLFWLMGDLSYARAPLFEAVILCVGLFASFRLSGQLMILMRGENEAKTLGIATKKLHIQLYLLSSILTAAAVTLAGCIGFVGLIVPHVLRLMKVYDPRALFPLCVLAGGTLVTAADMLARTLFSPQQLPVGIMMALLGIPIFLFLLQKNPA